MPTLLSTLLPVGNRNLGANLWLLLLLNGEMTLTAIEEIQSQTLTSLILLTFVSQAQVPKQLN